MRKTHLVAIGLIAFNVSAQVLSGDEIMRFCKEKIKSLISDGRIEMGERSLPDLVLPEGSITLEASAEILPQNAFVDVRILVDGCEIKSLRPSFKIKRFKDVFVASKLIKPGEIITKDMLCQEEREITNLSSYITREEDIIGKEAGRRIQEGNIILSHYLKERPIINFGDIVSVIKKGRGFSVKARAMAISSGYLGKRISLRNLSSNKIIEGIVIDKEMVEVK